MEGLGENTQLKKKRLMIKNSPGPAPVGEGAKENEAWLVK